MVFRLTNDLLMQRVAQGDQKAFRHLAQALEALALLVLAAVREVQPRDVGARAQQRREHVGRVAGGPERGDDLGLADAGAGHVRLK